MRTRGDPAAAFDRPVHTSESSGKSSTARSTTTTKRGNRGRGISSDSATIAMGSRRGGGSGAVDALLFGGRGRGGHVARGFRGTGGRGGRPGRELFGRRRVARRTSAVRTRGGRRRLSSPAAGLVRDTPTVADGRGRGGCRGGGGGEPTAVLAHLAHERSDLLEVGLVGGAGAVGRAPPVGRGGRSGRGHHSCGRRQPVVHYGRAVGLVLLEVPVQVGLLPETPLAQGTLERLLLVVYVAHVPLQVGRYAERPLTVVALVRLFASVRPQVSRQVGATREHFLTKLARVPVNNKRTRFR